MKKLISLILSIIMAVSLLGGCANTSASDDAQEAQAIQETVAAADEAEAAESDTAANSQISQEEGKYPIHWDLTDIYPNDEAWEKDYDKAMELADELPKFRGTLNTVEGLHAYFKFACDDELTRISNRLGYYVARKQSLNGADPDAANMSAKLNILSIKASQGDAYADDEIFAIPLAERKKMFADPLLKDYAYAFRDYLDEKTVHYSEETTVAISNLGPIMGAGYDLYSSLAFVDMPYPEITMPDGSTQTLNESTFQQIMVSDYDHDFKTQAAEIFFGVPKQYANTYALALEYTIQENHANAKLKGFDTYMEYAFHCDDVDPQVYEKMKETTRKLLPTLQRYIAQKKKLSGEDSFYYQDLAYAAAANGDPISYDQACENMLEALSILGDDYVATVEEILESGHIDVYAAKGKETGANSSSCYQKEVNPYMLLNYTNSIDSQSTLCHETGHTMYAYYSEHNEDNNYTNNGPTIFTHEVTSITNEFLESYWGIKTAKDDETKLCYLDNILSLISGTLIRQMLYSEFEEYLYETVEGGGALDAETLSDKWMELNKEYYGDSIEFCENFRYRWAMISHFHYGFYVYKYATSCTYAAATSSMIKEGKEGAVENYRKFLTLGGSDKPENLLKVAGVDITKDETYKYVQDAYAEFVDQYEELMK